MRSWAVRFALAAFALTGAGATVSADGEVDATLDLDRAAELQLMLRSAYAGSFGGMWMDSERGLWVAVVAGDSEILAAVTSIEVGVPVKVRSVSRSLTELEALHAQIVAEAGASFAIAGVELAAVETDVLNNRINVVAVQAPPQATAILASELGTSVITVAASRVIGSACNSNADCANPLKAGLQLFKNGTFACMSSFVMRSIASTYYLATAGHCSNVGNKWQHPSGVAIGSATHQG